METCFLQPFLFARHSIIMNVLTFLIFKSAIITIKNKRDSFIHSFSRYGIFKLNQKIKKLKFLRGAV